MNPEISIIVTNYNHAQYIKSAVTSILNQTIQNYEVIIVDDKSTDNSKEIIESIIKLDDRIQKPIYFPQNKGKWFALNTAISTARGKLIAIVDADDECHNQRFERQITVLKNKNSFFNVCGFKHCYNQNDIEVGKLYLPQDSNYDIIDHKETLNLANIGYKTNGINHFYSGNFEVHCNSVLFYKQLWDFGMRYNPNELGLMIKAPGEDSDFLLRATLLLQKTSILKEPLYLYRRWSTTNNSFAKKL